MIETAQEYTIELVRIEYATILRDVVKKWVAYIRSSGNGINHAQDRVVRGKTKRQAMKRACKVVAKLAKNEV